MGSDSEKGEEGRQMGSDSEKGEEGRQMTTGQ